MSWLIDIIEDAQVTNDNNNENKMVKKLIFKGLDGATNYLIVKARLAFIKVRKVFIKPIIFKYFNPKCYIRIKIDTLSFVIKSILDQLVELG